MDDEYIRDITNGTEKRIIRGDTRIVGSLEVTGPLTNNSQQVSSAVEIVILSITETLTDAQLKTLGAAGVNIVPAQGPGTTIIPIAATLQFNPADPSTVYTTLGTNDLLLALAGVAGRLVADSLELLNSGVARVAPMYPATGEGLSGGSSDLSGIENQPLQLWNWSGVEYEDGGVGNTLDVTVVYTVKTS